jgi:phage baseplate assembly protein gpV
VRYCVNTTTRTLYFDGLKTPATGTPNPGSACPSIATGWTHSALVSSTVANTASAPLFRYDSATLGSIRAVAMDLRLDAGTSQFPTTTALRTAAFLRTFSGAAPSLGVSDLTVTCNADHTGLLGLAVGTDASGNPLTATYTTSGGIPLGSGTVNLATSVQGDIKVTVTNVLGLSQLLTKTVSC